jgi:Lon protease-like protein
MSPPDNGFLRLFPLQSVVLFPGMEVPLVVFEPRYLQLIKECTDTDEPFGVLLLQSGREVGEEEVEPFLVGTTAYITQTSALGDGRLSVTARGGERFKVRTLVRQHPYLSADVEYPEDLSAGLVQPALITDVKDSAVAFVRELMALRGGFVRDVPLPDEPIELSYQVAQLFHGNAEVQQRLLEHETLDRLQAELDLIGKAMERLDRRKRHEGPGASFSPN